MQPALELQISVRTPSSGGGAVSCAELIVLNWMLDVTRSLSTELTMDKVIVCWGGGGEGCLEIF